MRSESEKKAHKEELARKYQEKVRLTSKPRTLPAVCLVVSEWVGGTMNDEYLEYTTLWKWLGIRAEKEGKNLLDMPTTKGGIKLSLEYLRRVHDDQMAEHTAKSLRERCGVKLDDYLMWSESELADFIFRCEQLIETDRMERQTHVVRKKMVEGIKEGDKKMTQMWMEMTGRDKADLKEKEGFTMKVVDRYEVKSDEIVPGEVKEVK